MKSKALVNLFLIAILAAAAVAAVFLFRGEVTAEDGQPVALTRDGLVINEVMARNSSAVAAEDGGFYDWIEIANEGSLPVSLGGLALSDKESEPLRFPLPDVVVLPGEQIVIWCSGIGSKGPPIHAGFRLSAGETIALYDGEGNAVDSVVVPNLESNHAYARQLGGAFLDTAAYSPGHPNTEEGHAAYTSAFEDIGGDDLRVNEIMSANRSTLLDGDGEATDWIELVNTGAKSIDLTGYSLSDDSSQPRRWAFSGGTIEPGEVLLVYASGKDRKEETPAHLSFRLSAGGETVLLYNPQGILIDRIDVPELKDDEVYALTESGEWQRSFQATPGLANTQEGVQEMARRALVGNNGLYIAKAVSGNGGSYIVGEQTPDWAEIVNKTGAAVDLSGYGLSDSTGRPLRWQFPTGTILENNARLVVALNEDLPPSGDGLWADFNLSMDGGDLLALSSPQGEVLDKIALPALRQDIAIGRDEQRTGLFYFSEPVPGEPNQSPLSRLAPKPELTPGGLVQSGFQASASAPGYTLRYTLDASEPTVSSSELTGPLDITKTTVLRVAAFAQDAIPSLSVSATYIVGENHTLPVVALVTDPDNLFDHNTGIYADGPNYKEDFPHGSRGTGANFWMDWERPVHLEIFNYGDITVSQNAGVKINGQYSRALLQKTLAVYARNQYETDTIDAPLFPNRGYEQVRAIVLRSTAQDNNRARMRDAMLTGLAKDTGVMYQDAVPCIVYINGEYWGHYNMRERVNKNSIAQWEGIPLSQTEIIDNIDLIKGNSRALNGTNTGYREIIDFVKNNSLTSEENLKWVTDRVDVQSYFDYQAMEMIIGNSDNGNIKFYNTNTPGSKWKWILYDVDWAYNTSESVGVTWNTFDAYLDPRGTGVGDQFENVLFRKLLENTQMKELFIERFAYHLRYTYSPENVNAAIDAYYAKMLPEMEKHYERWPRDGSVESWERHVGRLRTYANERPAHMRTHFQKYFSLSDARIAELLGE